MTLDDVVSRRDSTLSAKIDGQVVALDVAKGVCYGLDPIGSRVWALIEQPVAVATVCQTLMSEYDVDASTCEADVLDLCEQLCAEGLIALRPEPNLPST